ncbi:MAG: dihydrodipicolinate reductase [Desulfosarcinaceae bacterium]
MTPVKIMINGLPGNVTQVITRLALADSRVEILPWSLTGPEINAVDFLLEGTAFSLLTPDHRDDQIAAIKASEGAFISVDFTHPTAVNANAEFYCRHGLPFVMGTTGGDRRRLVQTVEDSGIAAVIAPNMAKQIVGFQAMMAYAADTFPDLFKGYRLTVRESHQAGKADTSGTAKAMVGYFNKMGIPFEENQIEKERDPERQSNMLGVQPEYLSGHGWHTYTLISADQTAKFEFTHNINGRDIYAEGTVDAILFLNRQIAGGARGRVFSMMDVLKAGAAAS